MHHCARTTQQLNRIFKCVKIIFSDFPPYYLLGTINIICCVSSSTNFWFIFHLDTFIYQKQCHMTCHMTWPFIPYRESKCVNCALNSHIGRCLFSYFLFEEINLNTIFLGQNLSLGSFRANRKWTSDLLVTSRSHTYSISSYDIINSCGHKILSLKTQENGERY